MAPTTTHTNPAAKKRGRKGSKIQQALLAVPKSPVNINSFMTQHGVSLAVLRQSKRFVAGLDPAVQERIGTVHVKQDKSTKTLTIWRD